MNNKKPAKVNYSLVFSKLWKFIQKRGNNWLPATN